jgi:hypothetical protein
VVYMCIMKYDYKILRRLVVCVEMLVVVVPGLVFCFAGLRSWC